MVRRASLWVLAPLVAACRFDPSGVALVDGGADIDARADAIPADASMSPDAGACPEPLRLSMSIGGVSEVAAPGAAYVHALIGDVIELSAAGSCTQRNSLRYTWQVSPVDATRATAQPDLSSETLTIYPTQAREYVVTLTLDDGEDSLQRTVLGVVAHGWAQRNGLPGSQEIRDLAVGGGALWIAHKDGAHGLPLGTEPGPGGFFAVNEGLVGPAVGGNLAATHHSAEANLVWFGQDAVRPDLWRVNLGASPPVASLVEFGRAGVLEQPARVHAVGLAAPGVVLATDRGITISEDLLAFGARLELAGNDEAVAVATGAGRRWAGGRRLHDIDQGGVAHDPFQAGSDSKIRALAVDELHDELWIGSDGNGVARTSSRGDFEVLALYGRTDQRLTADRIRDLAVETTGPYAGDVWAATSAGVARYIRARDTWLVMGNGHGLNDRLNVNALIVDERDGRRVVYAGTRSGLVSMQVPAN